MRRRQPGKNKPWADVDSALAAATPSQRHPQRGEKMAQLRRITPFLWFDKEAEEAAHFYVGIFPNSRLGRAARYGEAGKQVHQRPVGSVMTIEFELDGQPFTALNGGPLFKFNESISFVVHCKSQEEVDHYWDKLSAGGDAKAQQCGW